MEGSPAKTSQVANAGESPLPEKRILRRRFVQSTLFSQNQAEELEQNPDRGEAINTDGVDDGDEQWCSSQGKRKRKQTPKKKSQPRSSKKVAHTGKAALAGVNDDYFPDRSPQKKKEKSRKPPAHAAVNGQASLAIPDLRLEAKMIAEVDSRRFAGRQLHPFFSSLKVGKKKQETDSGESIGNMAPCKSKSVECGPIHVFDNVKDSIPSIDWSNWTLSDDIFHSTSCTVNHPTTVYECFVGCLKFDSILDASKLLREPTNNHSSELHEVGGLRMMDSSVPIDNVGAHRSVAKTSNKSENSGCLRTDIEQDNLTPPESLSPYRINRENQPENSLWTLKYQPEKALEVCGNAESVKVLSEWLSRWRETDLRHSKKNYYADKCSSREDNCDLYDSDYDEENLDETFGLDNVLLVKGPVGSGKSAAIYACAKEQGFEVIEVNASDWRSGALVKQKFGEAVGLHWLKRTPESPISSRKLQMKPSFSVSVRGAVGNESNSDVIEVTSLSEDQSADDIVNLSQNSVCSENNDQGEIKTLILFEEVDANLNEDRGFISTIQHLAQMSRRPMILTTNSCSPALLDNLNRLEVCFMKPLQNELFSHVTTVLNAEKADNDPCMIEKYIQYCEGDIRKTLMHLQFWCLGGEYDTGGKVLQKYSPLIFDVEAGHHVLPKIIPWGFPSKLSEYIETEISKSVCRVKESAVIFPWNEEMKTNSCLDELVFHGEDRVSVDAKKEVLLSRNTPDDGNNLMTSVLYTSDVLNCSESPVAFSWRNTGRNLAVVMSDSDDDIFEDESPGMLQNLCSDSMCGVNQFPDMHPIASSLMNPCSPSGGVVGFSHHYSVTENIGNIHELCLSASGYSMSFVPESTCVPETELNSKTEFSSKADMEVTSLPNTEYMDKAVFRPPDVHVAIESTGCINVNPLDEELGDSQKDKRAFETCSRRLQLLDECSRMDFCRGPKRLKKCCSLVTADPVQQSWKDLRCEDLSQHLATEHKDASQAMNLAYELCNLLSASDLLLHDCGILTTESTNQEIDLIGDNNFTFGWHDQQVEMTSAMAEHGYCVFAKDAISLGSRIGSDDRVNIACEMIASTSNSMALGKLIRYDKGTGPTLSSLRRSESDAVLDKFSIREWKTSLEDIVHSIVPPKCYLSLRGDSLHEYLSSLAHMSQSETSRISGTAADKPKRRRVLVGKNYLTSRSLSLSPENIQVLSRYNRCAKRSSLCAENTRALS